VTINIGETDLSQPGQLRLDVEQLVRRVLILWRNLQGTQEGLVQAAGRRRYVFEVAEHTSRSQEVVYLAVQVSFSLVADVMNCEAGHDGVERSERRR